VPLFREDSISGILSKERLWSEKKMLFFSQGQNVVYIIFGTTLIFLVYLYSTGRKRRWLNRFGGIDILQRFSRIPNTTRNVMKGLMVSVL